MSSPFLYPSVWRSALLALVIATLSLTLGATAHAADAAAPAPAAATKEQPKEAPKEPAITAQQKAELVRDAEFVAAFDPQAVIGAPKPWQIGYQEAESPIMEQMHALHDGVMIVIVLIVVLVMGLMLYIILRFNRSANPHPQRFTHNKTVEVVWTVIPILILIGIAIPSLRAHFDYYNNENIINNPDLTLKVVGHQWYWSYEYPDQGIAFDSNIKTDKELLEGEPRLLAVDNPVVVPVGKVVRVQITSADVIHAWALPAFGVKKGAVPGRLNETWFTAEKEGIYYGQCSVLCGKSHGFMPIEIVVVSPEKFERWVKGAKLKYAQDDRVQFARLSLPMNEARE